MLSLLDKSTRDMLQAFSLCSRGLSKQHVQELSRSENPLVATGGRSRMEAVVSSVNGASAPSSGLTCVLCNVRFEKREAQVEHIRLDWHRFNLRQQLAGRPPVTEDVFDEIALLSDMSSISASDSEHDGDLSPLSTRKPVASAPELEDSLDYIPATERAGNKVTVEVGGSVYSLYRALVHPRKVNLDKQQLKAAVETLVSSTCKCVIIMLSAGHFAGAVFDGENIVVHKTFHRYVVRAKRGTAQSVHDGQGRHAKSAGANLRRYNEEKLKVDVAELFEQWSEHIKDASLIFLRVPLYQRPIFFGGRSPLLAKGCPRVRTIPFPTCRPTFKEVQRVHTTLFTLRCHGPVQDMAAPFAQPPAPVRPEPTLVTCSSSDGVTSAPSSKGASPTLSRREQRRRDSPRCQQLSTNLLPHAGEEEDDESGDSLSGIAMSLEVVNLADRLEELVVDFGDGRSVVRGTSRGGKKRRSKASKAATTDGGVGRAEATPPDESIVLGDQLLAVCRSGNTLALQNLLMQRVAQISASPNASVVTASTAQPSSAGPSGTNDMRHDVAVAPPVQISASLNSQGELSPEASATFDAATDREGVDKTSKLEDPVVPDTDDCSHGAMAVTSSFSLDAVSQCSVIQKLLNSPQGSPQRHLLVAASEAGRANVVRLLLECGADPVSRGHREPKAYAAASDKTVRDTFRRFRAEFPDRFDYKAAAVDAPLSEEIDEGRLKKKAEKKKQQRQPRQQREKEKKVEASHQAALEKERQEAAAEKQWLASLTDRQKRALAAERRLKARESSESGGCALCHTSLAGRVPFSKFDLQYCSMDCVKAHQARMVAK